MDSGRQAGGKLTGLRKSVTEALGMWGVGAAGWSARGGRGSGRKSPECEEGGV